MMKGFVYGDQDPPFSVSGPIFWGGWTEISEVQGQWSR